MAIPLVQPVTLPMYLPKLRSGGFFDSFDNDASGATPAGWTVSAGTWTVSGGVLKETDAAGDNRILVAGLNGRNFYAECEWSPQTKSNCGIFARYIDSQNFYMALYFTTGPSVLIYSNVANLLTQIASGSISLDLNAPHRFAFSVVGTRLSAYFDGSLAASANDSSLSGSGQTGLRFVGSAGDQLLCNWFRVAVP